MNIKKQILMTPFAKSVKDIEAKILSLKIRSTGTEIIGNQTVYCISPYKTGTTYLSGSFKSEISKHEPLHYLTLISLENKFDSFFINRLNHLDLKLECSGFWSVYINELANHDIAKDLNYICILRSPSSWITSVINYWNRPESLELYYEFINELFWINKVGVDLRGFMKAKEIKKQEIIERLITFYMDFTKSIHLLNNVTFISLKKIDDNLPLVGSLINSMPQNENGWKREGNFKEFVYKNEAIDFEYDQITEHYIN